jgi:hypothetical protein
LAQSQVNMVLTHVQINEEHESLKQKWNSISQMMK